MTTEMRKTGVDVVSDMAWGTHFCLFYETKADRLETTVAYCKAGLESQEFCLWVVAEPLAVVDAKRALQRAVSDFDRYFADQSIEIVAARDWYLQDGTFDLNRVIGGWNEKLVRASARGYAGVRVTGDTTWLEKKDWKDFVEYEDSLNKAVANQRLGVLCTYPLAACGERERYQCGEVVCYPGLRALVKESRKDREKTHKPQSVLADLAAQEHGTDPKGQNVEIPQRDSRHEKIGVGNRANRPEDQHHW